jgi:uncharacterized protein (DUF433 family)
LAGISRRIKPGDKQLIERHVDQDVERYPNGRADARLRDSGVSVWAIVGFLRVYDNDDRKVAEHFDLSAEEIEAALAYYRLHKQVIDARVTLNEA